MYSFRGLIHNHHGGEHGGVKADMVLEKQLRVLHLAGTGNPLSEFDGLAIYTEQKLKQESSKPALTVKHFLQQGLTSQ